MHRARARIAHIYSCMIGLGNDTAIQFCICSSYCPSLPAPPDLSDLKCTGYRDWVNDNRDGGYPAHTKQTIRFPDTFQINILFAADDLYWKRIDTASTRETCNLYASPALTRDDGAVAEIRSSYSLMIRFLCIRETTSCLAFVFAICRIKYLFRNVLAIRKEAKKGFSQTTNERPVYNTNTIFPESRYFARFSLFSRHGCVCAQLIPLINSTIRRNGRRRILSSHFISMIPFQSVLSLHMPKEMSKTTRMLRVIRLWLQLEMDRVWVCNGYGTYVCLCHVANCKLILMENTFISTHAHKQNGKCMGNLQFSGGVAKLCRHLFFFVLFAHKLFHCSLWFISPLRNELISAGDTRFMLWKFYFSCNA